VTALRVCVVYPDLLGTYGDGGNGLILAKRAQWRGVEVELLQAPSDAPLPEADLYSLGGGEDGPQVRAARSLIDDGTLARRVVGGAVVLAVCAGYQIVGTRFPGADGTLHDGVGLLHMTTTKGDGARAVGEVVAEVTARVVAGVTTGVVAGVTAGADLVSLPTLTGFENHGGRTALDGAEDTGDAAALDGTVGPPVPTVPLARVITGVGNGDGSGNEGALCGRVLGTYLHGPVLARNPALADLLLAWALEVEVGQLSPLDDSAAEELRRERIAAMGRRRGTGRRRRSRRAPT
jgi:lipid II isoglutaminyl synthase (glutamine-hydrolysing)